MGVARMLWRAVVRGTRGMPVGRSAGPGGVRACGETGRPETSGGVRVWSATRWAEGAVWPGWDKAVGPDRRTWRERTRPGRSERAPSERSKERARAERRGRQFWARRGVAPGSEVTENPPRGATGASASRASTASPVTRGQPKRRQVRAWQESTGLGSSRCFCRCGFGSSVVLDELGDARSLTYPHAVIGPL